jgi:hypothetical protein
MKTEEQKKWEKENPKGKAMLAWNLHDYEVWGDEPPGCVIGGVTEGQSMEREEVEDWTAETIKALSVIKEEYPERFAELYKGYLLDLEYLESLGKITEEERKKLSKEEMFDFGQEK